MYVGAVARTNFTPVAVLYEYSVDGDVRYSINQLFAAQPGFDSSRPAIEIIFVPDSISIAAMGVCRVQAIPDPVY